MAKKKVVKEEPKQLGRITAPLVNVRKTPAGIITKRVRINEEVEVLEAGAEWVKIKGGYVRADLIEIIPKEEPADERLADSDN